MPIHRGYERHRGERMGYYQWGDAGKRYYYTPGNETSRKHAKAKAERQQTAAHASGYEG